MNDKDKLVDIVNQLYDIYNEMMDQLNSINIVAEEVNSLISKPNEETDKVKYIHDLSKSNGDLLVIHTAEDMTDDKCFQAVCEAARQRSKDSGVYWSAMKEDGCYFMTCRFDPYVGEVINRTK